MKKAIVLFSGGQDSATCLVSAKKNYEHVVALTFDYGQRHRVEIEQAKKITDILQIPHEIFHTDLFSKLSKNSLTHEIDITDQKNGNPPSTFVPGRNLIFLSLAAMKAYQLGISEIITGVCQTDYSGYPDCRKEFITSLENTISLSVDKKLTIHTPLMWLTKAESIQMMVNLGHLDLLKESHTCYMGMRPACSKCPACELRLKGFKEAGVIDPLEYSIVP